MELVEERTIEYTVDGELQQTTERVMTPTQILRNAGIDLAIHYLVQLEGEHQRSYKDEPNAEIHMHPHMRFISVSTGPTPVS